MEPSGALPQLTLGTLFLYLFCYIISILLLIALNRVGMLGVFGSLTVFCFAVMALSGIPPSPIFMAKLSLIGEILNQLGSVVIILVFAPMLIFWFYLLKFSISFAKSSFLPTYLSFIKISSSGLIFLLLILFILFIFF